VWIGVTIAAIANPATLPVAFAATAVLVADVCTRDGRAGTTSLVRSAPHLRERFVWWKLASAAIVAFVVMAVPIVRAPSPAAAVVATIFIACLATAIGVVSGNPKAFTVLFLTFWYIVVKDKATAALNFGGVHGAPRLAVTMAYAGVAIGAVVAAQAFYAMRLRRGE
jgi:hypothetical protein